MLLSNNGQADEFPPHSTASHHKRNNSSPGRLRHLSAELNRGCGHCHGSAQSIGTAGSMWIQVDFAVARGRGPWDSCKSLLADTSAPGHYRLDRQPTVIPTNLAFFSQVTQASVLSLGSLLELLQNPQVWPSGLWQVR